MHLHIFNFCGECGGKPWHVNTENLVSMPMTREQVEGWLNAQTAPEDAPDDELWGFGLVEVERIESNPLEGRVAYDNNDIARWEVCEGPCPHDGSAEGWKHLDAHPYVALERPQHFAAATAGAAAPEPDSADVSGQGED